MVLTFRIIAHTALTIFSTVLIGIFVSALWPNLVYLYNRFALGGKTPVGNPPTPRTRAVWLGFLTSAVLTLCSTVAAVVADSLPWPPTTETPIASIEVPSSTVFVSEPTVSTPSFTQEPAGLVFSDNFDGVSLNTTFWSFSSNSAGAGYLLNDGYLTVNGGLLDGGGGTIKSQDAFTLDGNALRFQARVRTGLPGSGTPLAWWGFVGPPYVSALIGFDSQHKGITTLWGNGNGSNYYRLDGDTSEWHDFIIEIYPDHISFYIDGNLEYDVARQLQITLPLQVVLDCGSGATDQWMEIDNVILSRIVLEK